MINYSFCVAETRKIEPHESKIYCNDTPVGVRHVIEWYARKIKEAGNPRLWHPRYRLSITLFDGARSDLTAGMSQTQYTVITGYPCYQDVIRKYARHYPADCIFALAEKYDDRIRLSWHTQSNTRWSTNIIGIRPANHRYGGLLYRCAAYVTSYGSQLIADSGLYHLQLPSSITLMDIQEAYDSEREQARQSEINRQKALKYRERKPRRIRLRGALA